MTDLEIGVSTEQLIFDVEINKRKSESGGVVVC